MPRPPTALMVAVIVGLAAGTTASQDADGTVPTVKYIMMTMTVPASDAIFDAAADPPKEAAQWVDLRASAVTLVESGRMLTTTARAKDDDWIMMARALVTAAEATFTAIDAKDPEGLAEAGDNVFLTCKTCHDRFVDQ